MLICGSNTYTLVDVLTYLKYIKLFRRPDILDLDICTPEKLHKVIDGVGPQPTYVSGVSIVNSLVNYTQPEKHMPSNVGVIGRIIIHTAEKYKYFRDSSLT